MGYTTAAAPPPPPPPAWVAPVWVQRHLLVLAPHQVLHHMGPTGAAPGVAEPLARGHATHHARLAPKRRRGGGGARLENKTKPAPTRAPPMSITTAHHRARVNIHMMMRHVHGTTRRRISERSPGSGCRSRHTRGRTLRCRQGGPPPRPRRLRPHQHPLCLPCTAAHGHEQRGKRTCMRYHTHN